MVDISYRIFDLVVSTNSLAKTAELVHLSPSAVSHSLRKLEQTLGMQLVIRGRDGVKLTTAGKELLPHVRYTLKAEERLQQEISRISDVRAGVLHVGVFSSVGCNWMPEILRRICRSVPTPVVAGGLLSQKKDVLAALDAGAVAVSTTDEALWNA